jgi:hypothetical protein
MEKKVTGSGSVAINRKSGQVHHGLWHPLKKKKKKKKKTFILSSTVEF